MAETYSLANAPLKAAKAPEDRARRSQERRCAFGGEGWSIASFVVASFSSSFD